MTSAPIKPTSEGDHAAMVLELHAAGVAMCKQTRKGEAA